MTLMIFGGECKVWHDLPHKFYHSCHTFHEYPYYKCPLATLEASGSFSWPYHTDCVTHKPLSSQLLLQTAYFPMQGSIVSVSLKVLSSSRTCPPVSGPPPRWCGCDFPDLPTCDTKASSHLPFTLAQVNRLGCNWHLQNEIHCYSNYE